MTWFCIVVSGWLILVKSILYLRHFLEKLGMGEGVRVALVLREGEAQVGAGGVVYWTSGEGSSCTICKQ